MFQHLLVPLDGSNLAEAALPAVAYLAKVLGASVTLLHVIEHNAPKEIHSERHLTNPEEAQAYLEEVARRDFPAGIHIERHVHTTEVSDVARSIVEHAGELAPDLVIMCTHGRGGVRDMLFGSIAQQVIAQGKTPVLLIRPDAPREEHFQCSRILLPLDGTDEHEQGVPAAVEIARACSATLHLLLGVPTFSTLKGEEAAASRMMPGATAVALELAEAGGEEYLRAKSIQLKARGITVTAEVARGDPSGIILDKAAEIGANLIVLGTHGKAGTGAFWAGSVGPKVAGRSRIPLLLAPVPRQDDQ